MVRAVARRRRPLPSARLARGAAEFDAPALVRAQRRAKGLPPIGRADVIDVTWIAAGTVLGIDVVNYAIDRGGLAPALVAPVATAIEKHAREVAHSGDPGSGKWGADVGIAPGVAAVG